MFDGTVYGLIVVCGLLVFWIWECSSHPSSRGPDAEKASRERLGASPTEAPVVSGGTLLDVFEDAWRKRLESPPGDDRAIALSSVDNEPVSGPHGNHPPGVVGSMAGAGAPAVYFYRWVRPAEGKRLEEFGWALEHVDPRYGQWLVRKEERWP